MAAPTAAPPAERQQGVNKNVDAVFLVVGEQTWFDEVMLECTTNKHDLITTAWRCKITTFCWCGNQTATYRPGIEASRRFINGPF